MSTPEEWRAAGYDPPVSPEESASRKARGITPDLATPRPWKQDERYIVAEVPGGRPGGEVIAGAGMTTYHHAANTDGRRRADAALIVEAVNNYDRLRAIEAAATALSEHLERIGWMEHGPSGMSVADADRLDVLGENLHVAILIQGGSET